MIKKLKVKYIEGTCKVMLRHVPKGNVPSSIATYHQVYECLWYSNVYIAT